MDTIENYWNRNAQYPRPRPEPDWEPMGMREWIEVYVAIAMLAIVLAACVLSWMWAPWN